jgi:2-keto-4-pentenoate hydratase/2-oxohepta-3-ene-1,7-dioic acid hydratase in catechol pathway
MRIVQYQKKSGEAQTGWVIDDQIGVVYGDIFSQYQRGETSISLSSVKLLPPINPGKIICVGRNFVEHAREHDAEVPEIPLLFFKPPSSIIGPSDLIILPPQSKQVEQEAELAVVIGKKGRWIEPDNVFEHIFGYTIANDVTARDLQRTDGQWTRAKGFDTFCAIGPWIETDLDPSDIMITCHVNGNLRQMASTHDMVFSISQLIAFTSSIMTLEPGDLLLTGTPAGVGPLQTGDEVEISIDGIGKLVNKVDTETRSK